MHIVQALLDRAFQAGALSIIAIPGGFALNARWLGMSFQIATVTEAELKAAARSHLKEVS